MVIREVKIEYGVTMSRNYQSVTLKSGVTFEAQVGDDIDALSVTVRENLKKTLNAAARKGLQDLLQEA